MTIYCDGARSLKRLPHAKRALQRIVDAGDDVKTGVVDGFMYRVRQESNGDLTKINITAPFGIYVVLSDAGTLRTFVCDSAQSVALPIFPADEADRYIRLPAEVASNPNVMWPINDWAAARGDAVFTPVLAEPDNQEGSSIQDWMLKYPSPVCAPIAGEVVATLFNYYQPRALPVYSKPVSLFQATHCYGNGQKTANSLPAIGWASQVTDLALTGAREVFRMMLMSSAPSLVEIMSWKRRTTFRLGDPMLFRYWTYYPADGEVYTVTMLCKSPSVYPDASADFLNRIKEAPSSGAAPIRIEQPGSLWITAHDGKQCGVSFMRAIMAVNPPPADHLRWAQSILFYHADAGYRVVDYDTLAPQIAALAAGELSWAWEFTSYSPAPAVPTALQAAAVADVIVQVLAGGWPVDHTLFVNPYANSGDPLERVTTEAALFMDLDGAAYVWLRCCDPGAEQGSEGAYSPAPKLGGFKFSHPDGITRTALTMPGAILADVTLRPNILMVQDGVYSCLAVKSTGEVMRAYIGSPFGAWDEITLPDASMQAVRVFAAGADAVEIGLLGIGIQTVEGVSTYRVYMKAPGGDAWAALSPIPVESVSDTQAEWEVCAFGADGMRGPIQHPMPRPTTDMRE